MSHEQWRPVPGFPGYEVSSEGRVRSFRTPRYLAAEIRSRGHASVWLMRNGRPRRHAVHRLVLLAFKGPAPENCEGCHNDGDASNNRLNNLRWDTHTANMADKRKHGTQRRGAHHPLARLNPPTVRRIRELLKQGHKQLSLARRFGVSQTLISQIKRGHHWAARDDDEGGAAEQEKMSPATVERRMESA